MPRYTYILPKNIDHADWQCRGGISSSDIDANDYVLEIGTMQQCDTRMLALAAHIDEIRALFTTLKDDPLAVLIKQSWDDLTEKLNAELKFAKDALKQAENHLAKEKKRKEQNK